MSDTGLETLRREFGGEIVEPGQESYESVRRTAIATGSPAFVLRPKGTADVQAAVRFAAESGKPLAVRGGGHSFAGHGTNDDGIVIDVALLDSVEIIDAAKHIVRIGGGSTWGKVAETLAGHKLAISSGDTTNVGVGGLLLGGGIGWKVRKYGLALDQLAGAELVTADGSVVRASDTENADLFWAIRGGGGNFGIVTSFDVVAHPTTDVFYGRINYPVEEAAKVLAGWHEYMKTAPAELTTIFEALPAFGDAPRPPLSVAVTYDGDDPEAAAKAIDPLRRLGTVIGDDVARQPYSKILVTTPGAIPPGLKLLTHNGFVHHDVESALEIVADALASPRPPVIAVRSLGGAVQKVPADATAFAHRDAEIMIIATVAGPAPVIEAASPALAGFWAKLAPYVDGSYANFISDATPENVSAIYPDATYRRLTAVKTEYDPQNLFAGNFNITP